MHLISPETHSGELCTLKTYIFNICEHPLNSFQLWPSLNHSRFLNAHVGYSLFQSPMFFFSIKVPKPQMCTKQSTKLIHMEDIPFSWQTTKFSETGIKVSMAIGDNINVCNLFNGLLLLIFNLHSISSFFSSRSIHFFVLHSLLNLVSFVLLYFRWAIICKLLQTEISLLTMKRKRGALSYHFPVCMTILLFCAATFPWTNLPCAVTTYS